MSCGDLQISKEYVDNNIAELEYVYGGENWGPLELNQSAILDNSATENCQLQLSSDGIKWVQPDGTQLNVTDEVTELRKEVDMLKQVINELTGAYRVTEYNINSISLVESDEYPIGESEEDKYDRAMKGL